VIILKNGGVSENEIHYVVIEDVAFEIFDVQKG
jgi:hypothetical protein